MRSQSVSVSANQTPTIILVDGHSSAFRSYFGFAKGRDGGLRTSTGIPTSVCFGFLKSLLEVISPTTPSTWRSPLTPPHPHFATKQTTPTKPVAETPEDFIPDLKNLQELLGYFNLPAITAPGYEADDVLGTLANKASAAGYRVKILTGDRDLFQLVDTEKHISVLYLSTDELRRSGKGKSQDFGPEQVKEKLGILPEQVIDYKALCGDKSDNIPGVKGIGDKTAIQLITTYNSLDGIYAAIDELKGATKKKLEEGKEAAYHSQRMATIVQDVPLEINLADCQLKGFDEVALIPMLEKLEFKTFLSKVQQIQKRFGGVEEPLEKSGQEPQPLLPTTDSISSGTGVLPVTLDQQEPQPLLPTTDSISSGTGVLPVTFGEQEAPPTIDKSPQNSDISEEDEALEFFSFEETQAAQQQQQSPIKPRIIQTIEQLNELVQLLQTCTDKTTPVAWDTETTALEPRDAELVGIGCCWGTGEQDLAYIAIGHKTGQNLDKAIVINALRPILESENYPKALQNAKFDRSILRCQGIKLTGVVFDTMLASYVLNPETSHSLSSLSSKYLGIVAKSYKELVPKNKTIADISIQQVADYCGMDVYTTFQLVDKLRAELDKQDLRTPTEETGFFTESAGHNEVFSSKNPVAGPHQSLCIGCC